MYQAANLIIMSKGFARVVNSTAKKKNLGQCLELH